MKTTEELFKIGELSALDLGTIFKCCPDGVVIKNSDLCYISANKSYCNLLGITNPNIIIGAYENTSLPEMSKLLIQSADREVKEFLRPLNYVLNISENKIISVCSYPIVNSDRFDGIISVIKDITQEEAIKERFVNKHFEYINNQKQLQSQRETFVASIGHDLKNPTIAQIRSLELLLKGAFGELKPEQKEIAEMILDSCRYMNGMLSSLLSTYRNYGGAVKLNFEEFNFIDLLNECVSEMVYVAKDKGVNIRTCSEQDEIIICADKVQIKRVVMNLLSNGIKYAYSDTELKLSFAVNTGMLSFQFENKSPYLQKEKQKSIFAKYVSYSGVNKELGIGLGLYASSKIIKGHNGRMFVKSYEDNRNIFGFNIPVFQNKQCYTEIYF